MKPTLLLQVAPALLLASVTLLLCAEPIHAAYKKITPLDVKNNKFLPVDKRVVDAQDLKLLVSPNLRPHQAPAVNGVLKNSSKMTSYVDTTMFRQPSTTSPKFESATKIVRDGPAEMAVYRDADPTPVKLISDEKEQPQMMAVTSERREAASAGLRAIPRLENDPSSRFTHSIVFGLGGSDGYGF